MTWRNLRGETIGELITRLTNDRTAAACRTCGGCDVYCQCVTNLDGKPCCPTCTH